MSTASAIQPCSPIRMVGNDALPGELLREPVPEESRDRRSSGSPTTTGRFKGLIPARQALAESRNAVAVWIARAVGIEKVCQELGFRTPLNPYISTALGASEVRLLELAGAYRAMASGVRAEPHVIARVTTVRMWSSTRHQGPPGRFRRKAWLSSRRDFAA